MLRYSLCIEPVLTDMDISERVAVAAGLGFDAVEFWDPSKYDLKKLGQAAVRHHIPICGCTLNQPWKYRLNLSSEVVLQNLKTSIAMGKDAGCTAFIALAGDIEGKFDSQKNILIENLKRAADIAVKEGVTLHLEVLNSLVDHKGYYLDSSALGFEIVKCVDCKNIRILFDIYHMQIMEGNLIENITKNIEWIGHFHSAGVPGRHEHFLGEIHYPNIVSKVSDLAYPGYFGVEYWPTYDHKTSLKDVLEHLKGAG
jgi:hydroxypyruvate isomerase